MPVQAIAKGVSMGPRKIHPVAALVRGRTVADALVILEHTPRRSAQAVSKAIASARANAEHNHGYNPATLRIVELTVGAGPRLKRFRPISRGRAHPYQKRTSHIRVVVDGQVRTKKNAKPAAEKPVEAKPEKKETK